MEFLQVKELAKLGYTQPMDSLDAYTAQMYLVLGVELRKIQREDMEKDLKKK